MLRRRAGHDRFSIRRRRAGNASRDRDTSRVAPFSFISLERSTLLYSSATSMPSGFLGWPIRFRVRLGLDRGFTLGTIDFHLAAYHLDRRFTSVMVARRF